MARARTTATERIELRTTPELKDLLKTAAAWEQVDLTSFILRYSISAAEDVLARREERVVSQRDFQRILDLLENPPDPPPALIEAAREWRTGRQ
jgi:uncharacterized protein (DUF1778 family)